MTDQSCLHWETRWSKCDRGNFLFGDRGSLARHGLSDLKIFLSACRAVGWQVAASLGFDALLCGVLQPHLGRLKMQPE